LIDGWERLGRAKEEDGKAPVGYARALAGILENFSGGLQEVCRYLPARHSRMLKAGELRTLCIVPRKRFEETWSHRTLNALKAQ
jgi:hypothetical protein